MALKQFFRVIFRNQDEIFELNASQIFQSELYGFIEVEELMLKDDDGQLVVDPGKEKLRSMFDNVRRSFIPLSAIVRIDEVEFDEVVQVEKRNSGKVAQFPVNKKRTPTI